jgi:hypothetical protein
VLALVCVVAAGLALQVLGLRFVRYSLDTLRTMEDVLRSTQYEVVATGFEPVFRSLGGLYFQKKLMAVDSREELQSLVRRLAERRVAGWTYVPRFARGFDARTVEEWTRDCPWRFRVVEDRTPMVVEFGGVRSSGWSRTRGSPRLCPCGAGNGAGRKPCSGEPTSPTFPVPRVVKKGAELRSFRWKPKGPEPRLRVSAGGG